MDDKVFLVGRIKEEVGYDCGIRFLLFDKINGHQTDKFCAWFCDTHRCDRRSGNAPAGKDGLDGQPNSVAAKVT
jgi:hypothetical protein